MNAIRYICLTGILVSGLLVILFAIAEEMTLPLGVSSDIVAVINEVPEADQMEAARKFLEDRVVPHYSVLELLGGLIVACSLLCILLPPSSAKRNRDDHAT